MQRVGVGSGRAWRAMALPVTAFLIAGGATGSAFAHHSFAMFDHVNRVTLSGTVTQFQWTNPHVFIELDVPDAKGDIKHYSIECASPNVLMRVGWKYSDVKQGDKVTLLINPLKNGDAGGMLETATFADGRSMGDGNPPGGVFAR